YRGSGRGAAGDQGSVEGIAGCAVVRVDADPGEGELGHVGAANDDRARAFQPGDYRGVGFGRWQIVERLGAGEGNLTGNVEKILDRYRNAGERRGDIARRAQLVLCLGCCSCGRIIDLDKGVLALAGRVGDARQRLFYQLPASGAAGGEVVGERGQGG